MKLESYKSWNARERRPPLRTFRELSDELGVDWRELVKAMRHYNGPKYAQRHTGTVSNTWYRPAEFLAWFNNLPEDVRASLVRAK